MSMEQILPAFFEEFEKIAVSKRDASFMQTRQGRRPIRVHKLLENEAGSSRLPEDSDVASNYEHELGGGMEDKLGADKETWTRKKRRAEQGAIRAAVAVRPWLSSGFKAALPAAVSTHWILPGSIKNKSRIVTGMGILGGAAGVTDRALKNWSARHPNTEMAKELKKQGAATMRKVAAMAADLRRSGIGGVKRPPFATEDSKQFSFNQLKNSKAPGYFTTQTQQKHLRRPGPSIQQIATTPGG